MRLVRLEPGAGSRGSLSLRFRIVRLRDFPTGGMGAWAVTRGSRGYSTAKSAFNDVEVFILGTREKYRVPKRKIKKHKVFGKNGILKILNRINSIC